jgi:hypothetical protein
MSKRGGDSVRIRSTKVKRRKGVGLRTIVVLSSDDEDSLPTAANDYARVTKTRVGTSGKAGGVVISTVPLFEVEDVEEVNDHAPAEVNAGGSADASTEHTVHVTPAKRRKKANDTVSNSTP